MQTDFFDFNSTRRYGNHDLINIISLVNLNLPKDICLQPEHVFLDGIIPSLWKPEKEEISYFLQQVINKCLANWE
jgi:hypothetical protein